MAAELVEDMASTSGVPQWLQIKLGVHRESKPLLQLDVLLTITTAADTTTPQLVLLYLLLLGLMIAACTTPLRVLHNYCCHTPGVLQTLSPCLPIVFVAYFYFWCCYY